MSSSCEQTAVSRCKEHCTLSCCSFNCGTNLAAVSDNTCSGTPRWKMGTADSMTTELNRGLTKSPSGERLWSNIFQKQIPEDQKVAFQKLIQELIERRKSVQKLWKYVVTFICIGILASMFYYFFTCWSDYLEMIETKYIIRVEIYESVQHHSLIPWNLTNSIEAPVCLGISLKSFGEPSSKMTEKIAGITAIVALVMIFKGVRLGWSRRLAKQSNRSAGRDVTKGFFQPYSRVWITLLTETVHIEPNLSKQFGHNHYRHIKPTSGKRSPKRVVPIP